MKTVVGLFNNEGEARSTLRDFAQLGLSPSQIGTLSKQSGSPGSKPVDLPGVGTVSANGLMLKLLDQATLKKGGEGVMTALLRMGVSHSDASRCVAGLKRGDVIEAVVVEDAKEADARAIMQARSHQGYQVKDEDIVIPVIHEELNVAKRQVDAGGVRVTTHVSAHPVEKTVIVREERITIERRIVDRPVDDIEGAFHERTLEMKASSEEPVIEKHAHVVEEVRVHKDSTERTERIHDTLRHTDVELTDLPGERSLGERRALGPAYEFGRQLRSHMPDKTWRVVEPKARAKWEQVNPGTWERFVDTVHTGWDAGR